MVADSVQTSPTRQLTIGHLGLQFAKRMGYHVVGCNPTRDLKRDRIDKLADNQDDALRLAKSLNCAELILDARRVSPEEAETMVYDITGPRYHGQGGCGATIVLPNSQGAFDYATKITRKHGIIMTVSLVRTRLYANPDLVCIAREAMECEFLGSGVQRSSNYGYI